MAQVAELNRADIGGDLVPFKVINDGDVIVCFAAAADVVNNSTNNHRSPPIIANARKSSQRRKRRPMVASERIKNREKNSLN